VTVLPRQPSPYELEQRRRSLLLRGIRVAFLVLFLAVTFLSILNVSPGSAGADIQRAIWWPFTLGIAVAMASMVLAVDYFTQRKRVSTLFSIFVGMLAALLATVAIGFIIDVIVKSYDIQAADTLVATIKVLLGISLSYLGVTTVLQTQDDFRLVIPYVEFSKQMRGVRPLVLDTSALIDGRIADIASTNFLLAPIVIPQFVLTELQTLADSADGLKRTKGRRGLDVVTRLQRAPRIDLSIDESLVPGKAVDQMLIEFARHHSATIVTTDTGLARVANIQGLTILNLNDLANALKPALVPGERLSLKLIRAGGQAGQAVGFLPDGTMVVAENGFASIGQTVELTVTSSMQTSAGRLIFGRMDEPPRASAQGATADPSADAPSSPIQATRNEAAPNQPTQPPASQSTMTPDSECSGPGTGDSSSAPPDQPSTSPDGSPAPEQSRQFRPRNSRQGSPRNPRR
jgi:uncharacterized protein YacL